MNLYRIETRKQREVIAHIKCESVDVALDEAKRIARRWKDAEYSRRGTKIATLFQVNPRSYRKIKEFTPIKIEIE